MCKTLSRAVVESTVRIPVRFQGLSPRSQTVYCVPYSTITPVLRRVLSVVRAVYYEIALSYKTYIASGLPFSYINILISSGKPQLKIAVILLLHPSDTISGLRNFPRNSTI